MRHLCTLFVLTALLLATTAVAQDNYELRTSGRLTIKHADGAWMIERYNLNLALSEDSVFARTYSWTQGEEPFLSMVDPPEWADEEYEGLVHYKVEEMDDPVHDVTVRGHTWAGDGDFIIFRYTVTNYTDSEIAPHFSFEQVPRLLDEYQGEAVEFNDQLQMPVVWKTGEWVGTKMLQPDLWGFDCIPYSEYSEGDIDSLRYHHAISNEVFSPDEPFLDHDGVVNYINSGRQIMAPGASADVWMAVAWGDSEDALITAMNAALDAWSTDVAEGGEAAPLHFELGAAYPNPFNAGTVIPFTLSRPGEVELQVINVLGQRVATLARGMHAAGRHQASWNGLTAGGQAARSGLYIVRLQAGDETRLSKITLIK